jgi:hypothetical protein
VEAYNANLVSMEWHPTRAVLRSFGLALALLCVARAVWSWTAAAGFAADWNTWLAGCAVALAALALWQPGVFRAPYVVLGVLTFPFRWFLAFATMAALYFLVLTPIAIILRLTRRSVASSQPPAAWRISPARGDKPSYFRQF